MKIIRAYSAAARAVFSFRFFSGFFHVWSLLRSNTFFKTNSCSKSSVYINLNLFVQSSFYYYYYLLLTLLILILFIHFLARFRISSFGKLRIELRYCGNSICETHPSASFYPSQAKKNFVDLASTHFHSCEIRIRWASLDSLRAPTQA